MLLDVAGNTYTATNGNNKRGSFVGDPCQVTMQEACAWEVAHTRSTAQGTSFFFLIRSERWHSGERLKPRNSFNARTFLFLSFLSDRLYAWLFLFHVASSYLFTRSIDGFTRELEFLSHKQHALLTRFQSLDDIVLSNLQWLSDSSIHRGLRFDSTLGIGNRTIERNYVSYRQTILSIDMQILAATR